METTGAKCDSAEECVTVTTEKYCDDEPAVHVGPVVNIEANCVIDGDVKSSAVFNIKFYFKSNPLCLALGTCVGASSAYFAGKCSCFGVQLSAVKLILILLTCVAIVTSAGILSGVYLNREDQTTTTFSTTTTAAAATITTITTTTTRSTTTFSTVTTSSITTTTSTSVTYDPPDNCLPYDGSIVPDCTEKWPPGIPIYLEHSSNCSRFWECISWGSGQELCLYECPPCGGTNPQLCAGQSALTYDPAYVGPVCNWPADVDCNNGHRCSPGEECNIADYCGRCVEPGYCEFHEC